MKGVCQKGYDNEEEDVLPETLEKLYYDLVITDRKASAKYLEVALCGLKHLPNRLLFRTC